MNNCPVCDLSLEQPYAIHSDDRIEVRCPNCGHFFLDGSALSVLVHRKEAHPFGATLLAYTIYSQRIRVVTERMVVDILDKGKFPSPFEQQDNLILWLGNTLQYPGEVTLLDYETVQAKVGSQNRDTFEYILRMTNDGGSLEGIKSGNITSTEIYEIHATLSPQGWRHFDRLLTSREKTRSVFMAMKYGNKELARLVDDHLRPAVAKTGLALRRLDDDERAGLIDDRLRVEIRTSRILLADLTDDNAGAYWEAGFAEGLAIPVVYLCRVDIFESRSTHFDTNHMTTITWDPGRPEEAASKLTAIIRNTLPGEVVMSDDK